VVGETAELVSLDDIVQAAHDQGYGEPGELRRRFSEYRGFGLVGPHVTKAKRQGGEGLWHPNQQQLFLDVLRRRQNDNNRLPTIANLPVGLWRVGYEGITTEQVQRAMSYWGGHLPGAPASWGQSGRDRRTGKSKAERRPSGPRSLRRRGVEQAVERLAAPGASESAKRELRNLLEIMNDLGDPSAPDTWARAALGVIAPGGNPSPQQRQVVDFQHRAFILQVLAVRHLDLLCDASARPLWDWALSELDQKNRADYVAIQGQLIHNSEIGHLFERPLSFDILQQGCIGFLTILGMSLAILWGEHGMAMPPGEEPPPRMKIERRR
jgi:hypothetical protein